MGSVLPLKSAYHPPSSGTIRKQSLDRRGDIIFGEIEVSTGEQLANSVWPIQLAASAPEEPSFPADISDLINALAQHSPATSYV
jgi:hypothetical protein